MKLRNSVLVFCFCLIRLSYGVIYRLTDEEYRRMPPVINLAPYESCMWHPDAVYCTAVVNFVSDEPSELLTQMQEYSEHKPTHFNHTQAMYGICATNTTIFNSSKDIHISVEAYLNQTIYEQYKLKVKLDDLSCLGGKYDEEMKIGNGHIAMAVICIALIIFNIVGTLYDLFCKDKNFPVSRLLLCFSLRQNWQKLVAVPGGDRDPRFERFKCLYGIRAIFMTLVIGAHTIIPAIALTENTKFIELMYDDSLVHILMNGTVIMQVFLQLSAFLLVYVAQFLSEERPLSWEILPLGILKRWLRLTPAYGLVLGMTATWLQYAGTGPFWDKVVLQEVRHCQKDWWKNLLYINNYYDHSYCMPQAWYLAADSQLFTLGLLLYIICKKLTIRKVVLSILFIIGLLLPGLHTYFQDLDGTLVVSPTTTLGFFVSDPTFNNTYKRGHTNIASYVLGLAFGYLVYYLQKNNFEATKYKNWRPLYWAMLPIACCVVLLGKLNYADAPRMPMPYRVAMACLIKPIIGGIALFMIWGIIFKLEKFYRGVAEWRGWTSLGRVSYSAYLLHVALIRVSAGRAARAFPASHWHTVEMMTNMIVVTYIAAYIYYLTVEAPLREFIKITLESKISGAGAAATNNTHKQEDSNTKL